MPGSPRSRSAPTDQVLAVAGTYADFASRGPRLWDTDVEHVAARICEPAQPTEWDRYFAGVAYRPPC